MLKLTEMHTKTNETTTKSFRKVPPQFQHMMLVASSQGTVTLLSVIETIADFDNRIEDEDENIEAARTSCIDIVNWLYLVTKQKIHSTNTV